VHSTAHRRLAHASHIPHSNLQLENYGTPCSNPNLMSLPFSSSHLAHFEASDSPGYFVSPTGPTPNQTPKEIYIGGGGVGGKQNLDPQCLIVYTRSTPLVTSDTDLTAVKFSP
jgi:hypothetical protein